jgi:hypothetical protein
VYKLIGSVQQQGALVQVIENIYNTPIYLTNKNQNPVIEEVLGRMKGRETTLIEPGESGSLPGTVVYIWREQ